MSHKGRDMDIDLVGVNIECEALQMNNEDVSESFILWMMRGHKIKFNRGNKIQYHSQVEENQRNNDSNYCSLPFSSADRLMIGVLYFIPTIANLNTITICLSSVVHTGKRHQQIRQQPWELEQTLFGLHSPKICWDLLFLKSKPSTYASP